MSINKSFYLLGDFNINYLDTKNNISKKLKSFLKRSKLSQLVSFPTRICTVESKITESLIDLFITNSENLVPDISHNLLDQMADHRDLIVTLSLKAPKPLISYMRSFREKSNYSKEKFQESLVMNGITFSSSTDNIELAANIFSDCFLETLDSLCPIKTQTFKHNFGLKTSPELEAAFNQKSKLLKEVSNKPSPDKVDQLKIASKNVDKLLAAERRRFFHKKFHDNIHDPKKLWSNIQDVVSIKSKKCPIPENEITPPLALNFNDHFTTIGSIIYNEILLIHPNPPTFLLKRPLNLPQFKIKTTDVQEVVRIISNMKPSNSIASDCIPLNYVKDSLGVLALTITQLINLSIITNSVPLIWKRAIVTAVHTGCDNNPSNWRPIAILPVPSKAGESVVAGQLAKHCEKHKIFNPYQFGYRKASNTNIALATMTETIYEGLDNREISLLLLLDLSKAFDSVPHKLLIDVLKYYKLYQPWFESYLRRKGGIKSEKNFISFYDEGHRDLHNAFYRIKKY